MVTPDEDQKLFFLKAFKDLPTTKAARNLVRSSYTWRRVCGFESTRDVPSEVTLSRAFAEFSDCGLLDAIHKAILRKCIMDTRTILHDVSGNSTEIVARERGLEKAKSEKPRPKGRRGRRPATERRNTPPPSRRTSSARWPARCRRICRGSTASATSAARPTARGQSSGGVATSCTSTRPTAVSYNISVCLVLVVNDTNINESSVMFTLTFQELFEKETIIFKGKKVPKEKIVLARHNYNDSDCHECYEKRDLGWWDVYQQTQNRKNSRLMERRYSVLFWENSAHQHASSAAGALSQ